MLSFGAIKAYALKNKKRFFRNFFLTSILLLSAMAVVGFRVGYPYHFILSLPFLVLALRYSLVEIFFDAKHLARSKTLQSIKKHAMKYEKWIYIALIIGVVWYVLAQVLPSDKHPFEGMNESEVSEYVDTDLNISVLYIDRLEITGNELLDSGLLDNTELTADELAKLKKLWDMFFIASRDSEAITDVHRYFGQISFFSMRDDHAKSFAISYALYLKKFEMFGRIIDAVGTNERVIKALNEHSDAFGAKNSYYDVRDRHVGGETLLRRNLGRGYAWFLGQTVDEGALGEDYRALVRKSKESYLYLITHSVNTAGTVATKYSDDLENSLFRSWFPIQKNVADSMGKVHLEFREEPLIAREQVVEMQKELRPGDIFLQRRNWHLSNVGIPGFWPHAALYLGTSTESNAYFAELFPRDGYASYEALLQGRFPEFYAQYVLSDTGGYPFAVIEGQAPGIILQSLEKSAMADYVVALRPLIGKESVLEAVLRAIGNYGKPYDYNFDFETRDEIVCSELVYDAYLPGEGKEGLTLELGMRSGRKMISPNDIAEKFYNEYGTEKQELDFVYFIDGNEDLKKAFVKDANAFLTTWTRSKFSSLLE